MVCGKSPKTQFKHKKVKVKDHTDVGRGKATCQCVYLISVNLTNFSVKANLYRNSIFTFHCISRYIVSILRLRAGLFCIIEQNLLGVCIKNKIKNVFIVDLISETLHSLALLAYLAYILLYDIWVCSVCTSVCTSDQAKPKISREDQ